VSDRANTAAARSVSYFGGAGIQHIAISVGDVVVTARALRASGAALLPVPANYYDDLAAKYDIDAATLTTWRELSILYDRTADGEYLQLYTAPFDDRFFFEMIERRGAYHQYGVANAPVRLASLAEWRSTHNITEASA
jgi:4-hydroxyphenylpyruvate dioxygenase